jgi:CubicO group peptidase (beta-lactamase class C family)
MTLNIYKCIFLLFFSSNLFAEKPLELNPILKTTINGTEIPGMVAAVIVKGKIIATGAVGIRKKGSSKKVTINDQFHIGSNTKSMTATLAACLIEKKKISWDTTIGSIFKNVLIHDQFKNVTLIQLLSNTGGLPKDIPQKLWRELWENKGTPREQRMQLVRGMLKGAPKYVPGIGYEYSNAGFSIAGAMLETVSNSSWENLIRKHIFKALKMNQSGFRAPTSTEKIEQPWGHNPVPVTPEPSGDNPRGIAPAGAVHCSILDLAEYVNFHLNQKTGRVLRNKKSFKTLHSARNSKKDYALGWVVTDRKWAGGEALTHAGSNTMWYSVIWIAPNKKFAALVSTNIGGSLGFSKCDEVIGKLINNYIP